MQKIIKIKMVTDHLQYKKGQILELEEKQTINFLTNGKALKIHRKKDDVVEEKTEKDSVNNLTKKFIIKKDN